MIVLGLDPGFASCGWALVRLTPGAEELLAVGVIETEKSAKKRAVRSSDDNLRRARELASELDALIAGRGEQVACVAAESQSWPRSAGVTGKIGMAWGVIAALVQRYGLALVQASPQEVKQATAGAKNASKDEVEQFVALWAQNRGAEAWRAFLGEHRGTLHEHGADAVAVVIACLDSEVIRGMRALQASHANAFVNCNGQRTTPARRYGGVGGR